MDRDRGRLICNNMAKRRYLKFIEKGHGFFANSLEFFAADGEWNYIESYFFAKRATLIEAGKGWLVGD